MKTGSSLGAGTDADIFLEIFGDKANTPKLPLNKAVVVDKERDLFEIYSLDVFEIESVDVGMVT